MKTASPVQCSDTTIILARLATSGRMPIAMSLGGSVHRQALSCPRLESSDHVGDAVQAESAQRVRGQARGLTLGTQHDHQGVVAGGLRRSHRTDANPMEECPLGPSAATELQQLLIDTASFTEFLDELCHYAANTIGSGLSCGITLSRDGRPFTVAGNNATAASLDEVQYGHHDGPCLTAMRRGKVVTIAYNALRRGGRQGCLHRQAAL